jgi:hypothetical protein
MGPMRTILKLLVPLAAAASTAGCVEFSYVSGTYVGLPQQVVTIGCKDPYEVFDNTGKARFLVVSNALREVAGCGLDADPALTHAARMREAARTFLAETGREDCRIVQETPLADLRTEFAYSCPAVLPKGAKVQRLPGRY